MKHYKLQHKSSKHSTHRKAEQHARHAALVEGGQLAQSLLQNRGQLRDQPSPHVPRGLLDVIVYLGVVLVLQTNIFSTIKYFCSATHHVDPVHGAELEGLVLGV